MRRANEITKDIAFLIERISALPDSAKALIEIEALIERIRVRENKVLQADFSEVVAWTYVLINQRVKFDHDNLKTLY